MPLIYDGKFNAPMLWNSNFFMTLESMKILRVLTDVWLPDFKFGPGRCAMTLAKTPWYWETVTRNIALLDEWGEDFSIRHLVMPSHVECCTYPVLEWIATRVPAAPVNVIRNHFVRALECFWYVIGAASARSWRAQFMPKTARLRRLELLTYS
ncbi:hypothetical protein [Bradyrhizobium lablabi]|uniref:hypothetical protein n=1 Tax=Bradyrhizobium lablabi TaxID=722472 RepID=UPI001BA442D5|nr:hypothetical protein [Bradyrhizobium lablabi]MBR0694272.1 hypothetical protein [Bradyrhizobium lablabi]